jgi:diacylglycerol kinase family enzyme
MLLYTYLEKEGTLKDEKNVRKIKRRLKRDGAQSLGYGLGDHEKFELNGKLIVVPDGKNGELPNGTAHDIAKAAGWK